VFNTGGDEKIKERRRKKDQGVLMMRVGKIITIDERYLIISTKSKGRKIIILDESEVEL